MRLASRAHSQMLFRRLHLRLHCAEARQTGDARLLQSATRRSSIGEVVKVWTCIGLCLEGIAIRTIEGYLSDCICQAGDPIKVDVWCSRSYSTPPYRSQLLHIGDSLAQNSGHAIQ